MVTFLMMTQ
jgi:hypothetical protein